MSATIDIRPARKSDAAEIALLVNIAVHGGLARSWQQDDDIDGAYEPLEVGRLEFLKEDTPFNWRSATMAESNGEVVGMLLGYRKADEREDVPVDTTTYMRPIEELEAEANGLWFISMLGVHKGWRSKGVGARLLDVADAKQQETGARGQALIVEDVNEGARRLYERRGFKVTTSRPMVRFPGSSGTPGKDWLLMVKE